MPCPGKVPRAFELHVLDEVRQPLLVVVFQHRAGLDDQPQLGPPGRLRVGAHVVAQPVRQRAGRDLRVDRHQLRQLIGADRRGGGLAPGAGACASTAAVQAAKTNVRNVRCGCNGVDSRAYHLILR